MKPVKHSFLHEWDPDGVHHNLDSRIQLQRAVLAVCTENPVVPTEIYVSVARRSHAKTWKTIEGTGKYTRKVSLMNADMWFLSTISLAFASDTWFCKAWVDCFLVLTTSNGYVPPRHAKATDGGTRVAKSNRSWKSTSGRVHPAESMQSMPKLIMSMVCKICY